jgi:hypothetical protein
MKYLKMFENLDYGYEVIDSIHGVDFDPKYFVYFSQKDTLRLNRIGFKNISLKEDYNSNWYGKIYVDSEENIMVMKKEDEWYYVRNMSRRETTWYRCDQFGGLMSCLRNECGMYYKTLGMNESLDEYERGYKQVDGEDYEYIDSEERLEYTDKEFMSIKSLIPHKSLLNGVTLAHADDDPVILFTNILEGDIEHVNHFRKVWIFKLYDEWYLVKALDGVRRGANFAFKYYKCDQLDGLKNLIKDEIFTNV